MDDRPRFTETESGLSVSSSFIKITDPHMIFIVQLIGGNILKKFFGMSVAAASVMVVTIAAPAFAGQTLNGSGSAVPSLGPIASPVIVKMTHTGASNFIVHPVDATGDEGYSWANEIGNWSGTIFQEKPNSKIVAASVDADGAWTLEVLPYTSAPVVNPKSASGSGTAVIKFAKPSTGFKRISFTHNGKSNFIVHPISSKGSEGYLINEIGPYSGTKVLPAGTQYLAIDADGSWTVKVS